MFHRQLRRDHTRHGELYIFGSGLDNVSDGVCSVSRVMVEVVW
jgi:hypothetical protein